MSMLATFVALRISKPYSITTQVRRSRSELLSQQQRTSVNSVSQILSGLCFTCLHMTKTSPSMTKSSTQSTSYLMTEMEWGPVL